MFWAWADDIYRDAHVQELLLRLQDEFSLDVGVLLWCVWHAHRYGELDRLSLLHGFERAEKWSGNVTAKLRLVRRELKRDDFAGYGDGVKELRVEVAAVELAAEKVLFDALERVSRKTGGDPVGQNREGAGRRNLAAYVRHAGAARQTGFSVSLLDRLVELTLVAGESDAGTDD